MLVSCLPRWRSWRSTDGLSLSVHRLVASLAFMIHLSPYMNDSISPLLDVLQARNILSSKLQSGGCGEKGVIKEEVRKLIKETASLCPEAGS